jgi:AcrR family transcriptional regulator
MGAAAHTIDSPTRARILAAAQKRFAVFGYRRTGVADIARAAGVVPGTLYRYFKDKEDIFREVVRELHESWVARAQAVLAEPGTALERMTRMGIASVEFNRENSLINSIFRRDDEIVFAPLIEELHDRLLKANVAMIAQTIREGIREGTIRDIDPERAAYVLFMTGDTLTQQRNQQYYPYGEVFPVFGDILLNGLTPRQ